MKFEKLEELLKEVGTRNKNDFQKNTPMVLFKDITFTYNFQENGKDKQVLIYLPDDIYKLLNEAGSSILKQINKKKTKVSERYVSKVLFDSIGEVYVSNSFQTSFNNAKSKLSKRVNQFKVTFPIMGIELNGAKIKLLDFEIFKVSSKRLSDLKITYGRTPEEKKQYLEQDKKDFLNKTAIQISIDAIDKEAAYIVAFERYMSSISFVNYFAGLNNLVNLNSGFCYYPEQDTKPILNRVIVSEMNGPNLMDRYTINHQYDFRFKEFRKRKNLNRIYLNACKLELSNSFHQRLVTSIEWIGKGFTEKDNVRSYLNYVIALEKLLITQSDGGISFKFAKIGSKILDGDKQKRMYFFDLLKNAYNVRSKIVHEARSSIWDSELRLIKLTTLLIIEKILTDKKFKRIKSDEEYSSLLTDLVV